MTVQQAIKLIFSGAIALTATLSLPSAAKAVIISDPVGDFLPTYAGAKGGDLDVVSSEVSLNGSQLFFSTTLAAAVGTTPGASYVFGLDRGQGTQRLAAGTPSVGAGVFFDSVVILRPDGTAQFNDIINPANSITALSGGSTISGNRISGTYDISQFPSTGFAPSAYTWNLWPRVTIAGNTGISDFAPNASNASVSVPEPGNIGGLLVVASCVVFFKKRYRHSR